ncbi:MAG: hypothetical protein E5V63_04415 [Mesorhizobium sp.]|nr:MAG: hypothetical protein E5V63_04415 [Mesorhizobium sp.]
MSAPRELTDDNAREMARHIRNHDWQIMEKTNLLGTLWCCWWDKNRHFQKYDSTTGRYVESIPDDVQVFGLIDAMEFLEWTKQHPDWWTIGEWSDERYAAPVSLTDAGRAALANRAAYDMEPVMGGLVEPGWRAIPAEPKGGV